MKNLEVITLTKLNLKEDIANNKYWNGSFDTPFSKNKANWIVENYRAEDDDVLVILGYENKTISALVYLVPDLVRDENGIEKKIFWSQRWWISDEYKDTVLSAYVKNISTEACNGQVMIKFLGDNTKAYYEKQPFKKFSIRKRYIILFSLDSELLINKKSSLKKIAPLLKFTDGVSRKVIGFINKHRTINKAIIFKNVAQIDDQVWAFLKKHCSKDIVPKSKTYINWQISNNQYQVVDNSTDKQKYKCILGSVSEKIHNINLIVKVENEVVGFISAYISSNRFVVRYFITTKNYYDDCVDIMIKNLINSKCTILQTEDDKLGALITSKYLNVYSDVKELASLVHNNVGINFDNSIIKDQDGNMF